MHQYVCHILVDGSEIPQHFKLGTIMSSSEKRLHPASGPILEFATAHTIWAPILALNGLTPTLKNGLINGLLGF